MIRFFIKSFLRSLLRDKLHNFLNIIGLALGFAAFIYVASYILHEASYDKFHEKSDRIYRAVFSFVLGKELLDESNSEPVLAGFVKNELPVVEDAVRFFTKENITTQYKDHKFHEQITWTDANIFKIFDFKLLEGNPETALLKPYTVVLTETAANKYFGDKNALGESILLNNAKDHYVVSGILQDLPKNSHLQFDFLASFGTLPRSQDTEWGNSSVTTYLLLENRADFETLSQTYSELIKEKYIPIIEHATGQSFAEFEEQGNSVDFLLQPIEAIHLSTTHHAKATASGNVRFLSILGITGILILIIACFNFINLSTARASLRAKEIGVKKVIGSSSKTIIYQILTETLFSCSIALAISIFLLLLVLPYINNYSEIVIEPEFLLNKYSLLTIVITLLMVTLLAGSYPAFYSTRYKVVEVIKGKIVGERNKSWSRGSLVAFQYTVFIILIFSTVIIYQQIDLLQNQNPGFSKENVLVIERTNQLSEHKTSFKDELLSNAIVVSASYSSTIPSQVHGSGAFGAKGSEEWLLMDHIMVDEDFQNTLKIEMIEGSFFSNNLESDSNVIINQKAAQLLGWQESNNGQIYRVDEQKHYYNVIGIMKDMHLRSFRESIEPLVMQLATTSDYLSLRLRPGDQNSIVETAKSRWEQLNGEAPFEYFFLDDAFDAQYKSEVRLGKIIGISSFIAIIIACLGLFGLVSFSATKRRKEIGIRKINGATLSNIITLLNRDFVRWIAFAFVIACPVAWYIMKNWLENFAYKTALSWWVFALAGLSALAIAVLTVSWQTYIAASGNPVNALRYE